MKYVVWRPDPESMVRAYLNHGGRILRRGEWVELVDLAGAVGEVVHEDNDWDCARDQATQWNKALRKARRAERQRRIRYGFGNAFNVMCWDNMPPFPGHSALWGSVGHGDAHVAAKAEHPAPQNPPGSWPAAHGPYESIFLARLAARNHSVESAMRFGIGTPPVGVPRRIACPECERFVDWRFGSCGCSRWRVQYLPGDWPCLGACRVVVSRRPVFRTGDWEPVEHRRAA